MPDWNVIKDLIVTLGWAKGTLTVFFWLAHFWIFRQYKERLEDRQKEIDRLAQENREYRDRFISMLDKGMNYQAPEPPALPEGQSNNIASDEPEEKN